jgi:DUF1365 family protein
MAIKLLRARVAHKREKPTRNAFEYHVYYVDIPVTENTVETPRLFSFERFNVWSMYRKDHGARDRSSWFSWFSNQCSAKGIQVEPTDRVRLIAHPRLFGYAFNPISFWILQDNERRVKAVLCEVNNTFGDSHNYLLKPEKGFITAETKLHAVKRLYVSPFNRMEGRYEFSFSIAEDAFSATILYNVGEETSVATWMGGRLEPLTARALAMSLMQYPLMTVLVIARIHWQALKLWWKKVPPTVAEKPAPTRGQTTFGSTTRTEDDLRDVDVS